MNRRFDYHQVVSLNQEDMNDDGTVKMKKILHF